MLKYGEIVIVTGSYPAYKFQDTLPKPLTRMLTPLTGMLTSDAIKLIFLCFVSVVPCSAVNGAGTLCLQEIQAYLKTISFRHHFFVEQTDRFKFSRFFFAFQVICTSKLHFENTPHVWSSFNRCTTSSSYSCLDFACPRSICCTAQTLRNKLQPLDPDVYTLYRQFYAVQSKLQVLSANVKPKHIWGEYPPEPQYCKTSCRAKVIKFSFLCIALLLP